MTCLIFFATEGYLRLSKVIYIFLEKNWLFKVFLLCQQGLVTTMDDDDDDVDDDPCLLCRLLPATSLTGSLKCSTDRTRSGT